MNLNASGSDRKQQGRQVRGLRILLEEERREVQMDAPQRTK